MLDYVMSGKKYLTVQQMSDYYLSKGIEVKPTTIRGWLAKGTFPNAVMRETEVGLSYWVVPEADVKAYQPRGKRGRPMEASELSRQALAMRRYRERKKQRLQKRNPHGDKKLN